MSWNNPGPDERLVLVGNQQKRVEKSRWRQKMAAWCQMWKFWHQMKDFVILSLCTKFEVNIIIGSGIMCNTVLPWFDLNLIGHFHYGWTI